MQQGHVGMEFVFNASSGHTLNFISGKNVGLLMCGDAQAENSPSSAECLVVGQVGQHSCNRHLEWSCVHVGLVHPGVEVITVFQT